MNGRQALRLAAIGFFLTVRGFRLVMIDKTQIHLNCYNSSYEYKVIHYYILT